MPDEGWGRGGAPKVVTLEHCLAWGGEQRQRCRVVLAVSGTYASALRVGQGGGAQGTERGRASIYWRRRGLVWGGGGAPLTSFATPIHALIGSECHASMRHGRIEAGGRLATQHGQGAGRPFITLCNFRLGYRTL